MSLLSGLAGAAAGGIASIFTNRTNNAFAKRQMNRNFNLERSLIQEQNEYNSPINQMKRLQEAGLNPNLVYGQINSGNQTQIADVPKDILKKMPEDLGRNLVNDYYKSIQLDLENKRLENDNVKLDNESTRLLNESQRLQNDTDRVKIMQKYFGIADEKWNLDKWNKSYLDNYIFKGIGESIDYLLDHGSDFLNSLNSRRFSGSAPKNFDKKKDDILSSEFLKNSAYLSMLIGRAFMPSFLKRNNTRPTLNVNRRLESSRKLLNFKK